MVGKCPIEHERAGERDHQLSNRRGVPRQRPDGGGLFHRHVCGRHGRRGQVVIGAVAHVQVAHLGVGGLVLIRTFRALVPEAADSTPRIGGEDPQAKPSNAYGEQVLPA